MKLNLSWTEHVVEHASKLEFLLIEVAVILVVFITVVKGAGVNAYETNEFASLTVVWNRPIGYASFIDSGSKQSFCASSDLSCRTAYYTYWPGSPIIYTVKVKDRTGAILKDNGNTTADSSGRAKATWNWTYTVVAWPTSSTTCQNAGADCKISAKFSSNKTSDYYTVAKLKPNTDYRVWVCAPDCGTGTKIVDKIQRTAIPAKLNPVVDASMACNSSNKVDINFTWTPASGAVFDQQVIDYSVYDNNFAVSTYQGKQLAVGQSSYSGVDFAPNTTYYWRVNSKLGYSANAWVTSATGTFKTKSCTTVVTITCEMADFNRDGIVSSGDALLLSFAKAPAPYNPKYDLNGDNVIGDADALLFYTQFSKTCNPRSYATKLTQTAACSTLGTGNTVKVDFVWSPATTGYTQQYLDYDIVTHGDTGWPASLAKNVQVGQGKLNLENFAPGTTYYWRINTLTSGVWSSSAVKSFKTPDTCAFSAPTPKDLKVTLSPTTTKDGKLCTDTPYGANFSWSGSGAGWSIQVSVDDQNFGNVHSVDVSGRTSLLTTGADFNTPITFEPGKFYWWRIYYGAGLPYAVATIPVFEVDWCNKPALFDFPSDWPTAHGVTSQGPRGGSSHGSLDAIDITGPSGTLIFATMDGVVDSICTVGGNCAYGNLGNAIIVKNPLHEHKVIFSHLSTLLVVPGQNVRKGDLIGGMGCTGTCTGTHLHYEFRGLTMGTPYIPKNVPTGCDSETACNIDW